MVPDRAAACGGRAPVDRAGRCGPVAREGGFFLGRVISGQPWRAGLRHQHDDQGQCRQRGRAGISQISHPRRRGAGRLGAPSVKRARAAVMVARIRAGSGSGAGKPTEQVEGISPPDHHSTSLNALRALWICQATVTSLQPMIRAASAWLVPRHGQASLRHAAFSGKARTARQMSATCSASSP